MYCLQFWRLEAQDQDASMIVFCLEPSSSLQTSNFSLCPHTAEEVRELSEASFIRALILFMRAAPS